MPTAVPPFFHGFGIGGENPPRLAPRQPIGCPRIGPGPPWRRPLSAASRGARDDPVPSLRPCPDRLVRPGDASGGAQSPKTNVPPPIISVSNPRVLIQWSPGEVRCDGAVLAGPSTVRRPWNQLGWAGGNGARSITIRFAIDASGRPVSIGRGGTDFVPYADDVAPALTASRFAERAPHQDCSITYTMRSSTMAEADAPELMSYTVHPLSAACPRKGGSGFATRPGIARTRRSLSRWSGIIPISRPSRRHPAYATGR